MLQRRSECVAPETLDNDADLVHWIKNPRNGIAVGGCSTDKTKNEHYSHNIPQTGSPSSLPADDDFGRPNLWQKARDKLSENKQTKELVDAFERGLLLQHQQGTSM